MLKKIRTAISIALFSLITFFFIDFAGLMPGDTAKLLTKMQLIPAMLSLSAAVLIALAALTLLLGRVYCSSICPMGVFQDVVAWLSKRVFPKKRYRFSKPKNILRITMLAAAGVIFLKFPLLLGFIDPYSAYGRVAANVFRPVYMAGNNALEAIFTTFGSYAFYKTNVFIASATAFTVALLTMAAIGYLAWRHGRAYCNTICPVGTILGFLSKFSVFKIRIDHSKCNGCRACEMKCKAACISGKRHTVDHSRCVGCFSCLDICHKNAISFSPALTRKSADASPAQRPVDEGKRRFLKAGVATAVAAPVAAAKDGAASLTGTRKYVRQHPISPPGSVSTENMLKRCTSCHLCISKCPSRALKPAFMEYGLAGMMQPVMYFEKGFCNFDCTICSEVCPTGAIKRLTKEEKHLNQGGRVVFTRDICVVQVEETSCGACSEHCPTQAVTMIPYKDGLTIPHLNVEICIGCGGCEFICPARPLRAIHVEGLAVQGKAKPFEEQEKEDKEINSFGF
ncbi:MAG: 4Fe-4S dicluster domain-containing protein [Prevotellaceae bacterium]|jgi:ferredoxin|nr:4Fe-4S dicluster domain-containing protein [Prevotellaceae bacterium]